MNGLVDYKVNLNQIQIMDSCSETLKKCSKCLNSKILCNFKKDRTRKDGYGYVCKQCELEYKKNNPEKIAKQRKEQRNRNLEKCKERDRKYYHKNKEKRNKYNKDYYIKNKKSLIEYSKNYREKNSEIQNEKRRIFENNKLKTDFLYKLNKNIRSLINNSIRYNGFKKTKRTQEILGCTFEEFKIHIEKQWESWMNWENYGKYKSKTLNYGWDLDHIIPKSLGKTEEDIIRLNHHTNLKPLCSYVNRVIKKDNFKPKQ